MAPQFTHCKLHLPCISFHGTAVRLKNNATKEYRRHDILITTAETLVQFSWAKPIQQTFLLVHPWDQDLLGVPEFAEQPDFTDHTETIGGGSKARNPVDNSQLYAFNKFPGGSPVEADVSP
ncbi:hypothetical protein BDR07DRAFT_1497239 [Suillus spraguei]|nr:hypothetical protein BDR07DRAFT_1497239 [Suillus spraguei]